MCSRLMLVLSASLVLGALNGTGLRADDKATELEQLRQKLQAIEKREKALQQQVDMLDKQFEELFKKNAALLAEQRKLAEREKTRQQQVDMLDKQFEELFKKNAALLAEQRKLAERAITAEVQLEAALEKNKRLMAEFEALVKTVESSNPGRTRNPPKKDVHGRVTSIDADGGLVTVSIGADAGLEKGHTVEVFRTKPKPEYIGMLRIVEVKKTEAIGKWVLRRGTPGVDDEVSGDILKK